jgi:hypothetical protein
VHKKEIQRMSNKIMAQNGWKEQKERRRQQQNKKGNLVKIRIIHKKRENGDRGETF